MNLFLSIKNSMAGKLRVIPSLIFHPNLFPIIMSWLTHQKKFTRSDILKTMKSDFCNNTLSINLFDIDPVDIFDQV